MNTKFKLKSIIMKKHLPFSMFLSILFLGSFLSMEAQRTVVIEGYPAAGGGDITAFVDAIKIALDADEPNRVTDPDVTYILKRPTPPLKHLFFKKILETRDQATYRIF
jgi:hypothetical protein